ncbi:MAG TPA: hypothetical protein PKY95_10910, partial [candidate division Zixibacteria bacterium]|nr:hypothetical protein [candidate division Zixibacteria bacterium]
MHKHIVPSHTEHPPHHASAPSEATCSRREFLAQSGKAVAVSALAGVSLPAVHAAEDNTIRLALIGCGGRGSGAAGGAAARRARRA